MFHVESHRYESPRCRLVVVSRRYKQLRVLVGARGFGLRPGQLAVGRQKYGDLFLLAVGAHWLQTLSTLNRIVLRFGRGERI